MIIAEKIAYQIGGKQILHSMSFEAGPETVTVLLGANGAGKSTLLRILAGECRPDEGAAFINATPLQQFAPQQLARKRAVLTQSYAVPLPFTCEEIVSMGRYPHEGVSTKKENKKIVSHCMKEMNVRQFSKRMFNTLSGGEQQRVQMARVLAQLESTKEKKEKILLLDEPTSGLDYLQQQLILSRSKSLAAEGYTIVIVLHDLNLAAQYADKILLLKKGRLLANGSADKVLQSSFINIAYDMEVDVVKHEDYPFPILVPALHNQNRIFQSNKINNNGIYTKKNIPE